MPKKPNIDYKIRYPKQVEELFNVTDPNSMWKYLEKLTSFPNRGAGTEFGVAAAKWVCSQVQQLAEQYNRDDVTLFFVPTNCPDPISNQITEFPQPSVVAKFGNSTKPGIVVGAHLDTLFEQAQTINYPGANDDGSGSAALLEMARTLCASGMQFKKPIYIIWYAAEEMGNIGSACVVDHFKNQNIPVEAVLQDQIGFAYENKTNMWLEDDYLDVNKTLTYYVQKLLETYIKRPSNISGSGDSDEWIWTQKGNVPTARPLESNYLNFSQMYQWMHTPNDTMDKLSLSHMTDYLKLSLSFLVELAEPKNQTLYLDTDSSFYKKPKERKKINIVEENKDLKKLNKNLLINPEPQPLSPFFNRPALPAAANNNTGLNNQVLTASMFIPGVIAMVCFVIAVYKLYKAIDNLLKDTPENNNNIESAATLQKK